MSFGQKTLASGLLQRRPVYAEKRRTISAVHLRNPDVYITEVVATATLDCSKIKRHVNGTIVVICGRRRHAASTSTTVSKCSTCLREYDAVVATIGVVALD